MKIAKQNRRLQSRRTARVGENGEHGGIFFRLLFLLFFAVFLAVLWSTRHPLMRFAGETWVVDEPPAPCDAVIVLGGDNFQGDRAFRAADLYRTGVAPVVVASGEMLRRNVSLAEVMSRDLESFGVPTSAIVRLDHHAQNTLEEAIETSRLIEARKWKRVQVVTSSYHARRARLIFERALPSGVTFHVTGARDSSFDPSRWWETRQGQKLFVTELAGYVVAWWELRKFRNPETAPGFLVVTPALEALPVSDWKHSGCTAFDPTPPRYYSCPVTVLSGLLRNFPSLVATEFSVGGKNIHVA